MTTSSDNTAGTGHNAKDLATAFLKQHRTASLATTDEHHRPHAANIQYVWTDTDRLCFLSSEQSSHARHIRLQSAVALTVYDHDDRPEMIRGVQMHGRCVSITDPDARAAIMQPYAQRYPIVNNEAFMPIVARQTLYEVTPTWLRWIDNQRRFGFKVEWSLDA